MKILIAETDASSAAFLKKGLVESGLTVDAVSTGELALQALRMRSYDLALLDSALPIRPGLSVVQAARVENLRTPVIMLSSNRDVDYRVKALEAGADDFLLRPFVFSELLARVRSVLRRSDGRTTDVVTVGELNIDLNKHVATRAGVRLQLSGKEFALLSLLARRAGEVLTRTFISEKVWDMNFEPSTNVVDVHVHRLRGKVDGPFTTQFIHTIRGVGYLLEDPSSAAMVPVNKSAAEDPNIQVTVTPAAAKFGNKAASIQTP